MWDVDDVARSVRRYLLETIDSPPWRVRVVRKEVRDDARPVAVVDVGDAVISRAGESRHQAEVEWVVPVTVSAYPPVTGDEDANRADADALKERLRRLITHGLDVVDGDGRHWAGPFRVPLYDYAGVPLKGEDKAGPAFPHDVLFVARESVVARRVQDPEDPKRQSVFLEFRASVEAPGRAEDDDEPVSGFTPAFVP